MNLSVDLDSANRGAPKPTSRSPSGCDLDCQEELFGHLADRSQLCIMQTLCQGAKTDAQIARATGLSRTNISSNLERLLGSGCVKMEDTGHLVLYGLSAPRLLQLEAIVDEMLIAALKGRRSPTDLV
jgi:DNA-binding HxlR family transcriptional regulator